MRFRSVAVLIACVAFAASTTANNDGPPAEFHPANVVTTTVVSDQGDDAQRPHRTHWMNTPCAEEDSVNCWWNDGYGHPFYIRKMPGDITGLTCIFYVQRRYARNHDHCWTGGRGGRR